MEWQDLGCRDGETGQNWKLLQDEGKNDPIRSERGKITRSGLIGLAAKGPGYVCPWGLS